VRLPFWITSKAVCNIPVLGAEFQPFADRYTPIWILTCVPPCRCLGIRQVARLYLFR
jgi:hypothetical protein